MYRVIYFKNTKSLHDFTVCQNALRIPEVFLRLKQTLNELNQLSSHKMKKMKDIFHLLSMDEDFFKQSSNKLKSLNIDFWHVVMTIIQVGLYDRYLKSQTHPLGFVTPSSSDWAAKITAGLWTIKDMLNELSKENNPLYSIRSKKKKKDNNSFSFFKYNEESKKYDCLTSSISHFKYFSEYIEKYYISQIIVIGPNIPHRSSHKDILQAHNMKSMEIQAKQDWLLYEVITNKILRDNICVVESIDLDPLLSWFWKDYNKILRQKQNFSFIKSNFK